MKVENFVNFIKYFDSFIKCQVLQKLPLALTNTAKLRKTVKYLHKKYGHILKNYHTVK